MNLTAIEIIIFYFMFLAGQQLLFSRLKSDVKLLIIIHRSSLIYFAGSLFFILSFSVI